MSRCPVERFPALEALGFIRSAFIQKCEGIDVVTDRETALTRLWTAHRETADDCGFRGMPFAIAEQVHGNVVARVDEVSEKPVAGADGLITSQKGLCLAIYVADCAPVYLVDRKGRAIGLVHSGKKGTEGGVVTEAIRRMKEEYGCEAADLVVQLGPCIRPPHYEMDIPQAIAAQAGGAGVEFHDCGHCTASAPERYYSYRREKGRTGRLLALLALV